jgi:hypothetical protein
VSPQHPRSSKDDRRQHVALRRVREEAARAEFDALRAQYGLAMPGLSAVAVSAMLRALQADRYRGLDQYHRVPCRARLIDGSIADLCLLWFAEWGSLAFLSAPRRLAGGQVARLLPSDFTLPFRILDAARHTVEYRMGSYIPVLASIRGAAKYLVPAHSFFFRSGPFKGKDVDPRFVAEPSETQHRLGRYVWGDDLRRETTAIALELPGTSD